MIDETIREQMRNSEEMKALRERVKKAREEGPPESSIPIQIGLPLTADVLLRMAKRPLTFDEDDNLMVDENHPLL